MPLLTSSDALSHIRLKLNIFFKEFGNLTVLIYRRLQQATQIFLHLHFILENQFSHAGNYLLFNNIFIKSLFLLTISGMCQLKNIWRMFMEHFPYQCYQQELEQGFISTQDSTWYDFKFHFVSFFTLPCSWFQDMNGNFTSSVLYCLNVKEITHVPELNPMFSRLILYMYKDMIQMHAVMHCWLFYLTAV